MASPPEIEHDRPRPRKRRLSRSAASTSGRSNPVHVLLALLLIVAAACLAYWVLEFRARYTVSFRSPINLHLHWPVVIERRISSEQAHQAQLDQNKPLTAYQQYACLKFGPACRIALAIQRAENPQGKCDTYHYNSDGTLDWGYFQINTVHLKRRDLNLRDLLDCKANIDFAYQLYAEHGDFSPWSTYNNGSYRKLMHPEREK